MAATWVSKIGCGIMLAHVPDDLDVLARGVEHLAAPSRRPSASKNGARSMPGASASMTTASSRARHLRHAEQRVIGGFAQEFGVDGDEGMPRHARAGLGQFRGGGDQIHCGGLQLAQSWRANGWHTGFSRAAHARHEDEFPGAGHGPDRHLDQGRPVAAANASRKRGAQFRRRARARRRRRRSSRRI